MEPPVKVDGVDYQEHVEGFGMGYLGFRRRMGTMDEERRRENRTVSNGMQEAQD